MTLHRAWIAAGASLATALLLAGLLVWKPGAGVRGKTDRRPLLVYCAAALKVPAEAVARDYEREYGVPIQLQYGGSQTLLANLELSKRGDLYLPAEDAYIQMARNKHLVAETIPLGGMTAVLAVHKGNPKNVRSLGDLLRTEVRLGQADPAAAAVGKAVRETLQKTSQWEAIRQHTLVFKPTVNDVANDVKLGSVDAAFVWDVTVKQYPDLEVVPTAELANVKARLAVAVAGASAQPTAALRFARYLTATEKGLKEFARGGFVTAEGDAWSVSPELVLYSGEMNRVAVEETVRQFEAREGAEVKRVYDRCDRLVSQMKAGQRPDAYLACDRAFLTAVEDLFEGPPVELSELDLAVQAFSVSNASRHRQLARRLLRALESGASRARYEAAGFHWRGPETVAP